MNFKAILNLIRFNKPIGSLLLLWPTLWALILASNAKPPFITLLVFTLGVFLTRSAGCIINDYADIEFDKYVKRTKDRPLTQGIITKTQALLIFSLFLCICAIICFIYLKFKTVLLSVPAVLLMLLYPYSKRFFILPQLFLALAFSFGIIMAYVEITGTLNLVSVLVFGANFFWVLGYDTIYSMVDYKDDLRLDIYTAAKTFNQYVISFIGFCYLSCYLLLLLIAHYQTNFNNVPIYYISLSIVAIFFIYQILMLKFKSTSNNQFKMFLINNYVGLTVLLGIFFSFRS